MNGTRNSGKLIEVLWLITSDERSGMIFSAEFDARQINTTGKKASRTSLHKVNINHKIDKYINLIHTSLVRLVGYVTRMKVYGNIRKERNQKSSTAFITKIITRRKLDNLVTSRASGDQSDFKIVLGQMIHPPRID